LADSFVVSHSLRSLLSFVYEIASVTLVSVEVTLNVDTAFRTTSMKNLKIVGRISHVKTIVHGSRVHIGPLSHLCILFSQNLCKDILPTLMLFKNRIR